MKNFNKSKLTDLNIDDSIDVKSIDFENFSGCRNLKRLVVPDAWIEDKNMTNKMFEKCPNLSQIQGVSGT